MRPLHWKRICSLVLCLLLTLGMTPAVQAAPAVPEGMITMTRSLNLTVGETVTLPVGNNQEITWYVDGDSVQMPVPGEATAVRPGVSHVTAQGLGEFILFTIRVSLPQENLEEALVTYFEGPWSDFDSSAPYLIAVNKLANCVTVYTQDQNGRYTVPVDAMICSTGPDTPLGGYETSYQLRWCELFGDVWGQYCTVIVGNILFHSVPYAEERENTLKTDYFNLLGTACSMGCIRLLMEDTFWIFENCDWGTPVYIYEDENPGPWGKPEALQIGEGCTWDPTDPLESNPWHDGEPSLEVVGKIRYAEPYSIPNLLEGVTATDSGRGDATGLLDIYGFVDTTRDGEYPITYHLTDARGRTVSETVIYIVEGAD